MIIVCVYVEFFVCLLFVESDDCIVKLVMFGISYWLSFLFVVIVFFCILNVFLVRCGFIYVREIVRIFLI